MPKKSSTSGLSPDDKIHLDQFVEKTYERLLDYAIHITKDMDQAQDLLSDVLLKLYDGRITVKYVNYPMAYVQDALRTTFINKQKNRQEAFERGVDVQTKNGVRHAASIRTSIEPLADVLEGAPVYDYMEDLLHYQAYEKVKRTFPTRQRWILTQMEQVGITAQDLYDQYCETWNSSINIKSFRVTVSHILQKVRERVAAHLQDVG